MPRPSQGLGQNHVSPSGVIFFLSLPKAESPRPLPALSCPNALPLPKATHKHHFQLPENEENFNKAPFKGLSLQNNASKVSAS